MSDALACGRRFRTFNVVDDFNREALHIEVDTSITSARLVRIFQQLQRDHGLPQVLRTDNVLTLESSRMRGRVWSQAQQTPVSRCRQPAREMTRGPPRQQDPLI